MFSGIGLTKNSSSRFPGVNRECFEVASLDRDRFAVASRPREVGHITGHVLHST
jgi:hypothetical protein